MSTTYRFILHTKVGNELVREIDAPSAIDAVYQLATELRSDPLDRFSDIVKIEAFIRPKEQKRVSALTFKPHDPTTIVELRSSTGTLATYQAAAVNYSDAVANAIYQWSKTFPKNEPASSHIGKLAIGEPFYVTQSTPGAWQLLFTI